MSKTVFFAWQLDTNPDGNKNFIWNSLNESCKNLQESSVPELSPRPERDTLGISGTPNIVQTIFKKIDSCSFFIADVTFISKTQNEKYIVNPNVMLELGYAIKTIGWERTILVLNNAYGTAENLPFDIIQHRWPIEYRITSETKVHEKRFRDLTETLTEALIDCEQYTLARASQMTSKLDTDTFKLISEFEFKNDIGIPLPARTMGEVLTSTSKISSYRRLLDLGAISVNFKPQVCYNWTNDGKNMIREINRQFPGLLEILRNK
ncbi:hypothetical protein [Leptospira ryugenii]|uniref:hypothetical protein n=1 Tax=Leptospira ryugenii TaxID=1917863 RepID=UPI00107FB569|nr:hypothetical protein [Leptospira ryugenii]